MVMGMMISPNALDGRDLTRDPQGSGPWIWSDADSQAGVTEVYNLNPNYWNPADQGVETVTVTAVPDNNARLNALLTGEADIMSTTRDAQIDAGVEAGNVLISVPNFFAYLIITDRAGEFDSPLADERVRRAILLSLDRDAYANAMHFGKADSLGGIYPPAFSQFNVPELDTKYTYDPEEARRLLAEAGYPDGGDHPHADHAGHQSDRGIRGADAGSVRHQHRADPDQQRGAGPRHRIGPVGHLVVPRPAGAPGA